MRISVNNRQYILLGTVITCAVLALISITWAAFSSTLTLSGKANVAAQSWDIDFTNTIGTKWTTAQSLTGVKTNLAELPTSSSGSFGLPVDQTASGFLGTLKMSGDKITYTWYVQNFGTFDAKYSISGLISTDSYASGSNVDITCNTSDNSSDKTFCNNYVKTTLTIDGVVADASSSYTLAKAGQTGDSSTLVLTIEIIGDNQIYTASAAAFENKYSSTNPSMLSAGIEMLDSSSDLNISVKGLTLSGTQSVVETPTVATTKEACSIEENSEYLFDYTGGEQTFTVPCAGSYKLEVWGAQGGSYDSYKGGYGAYSFGEITLNRNEELYINVGGQGIILSKTCPVAGGYNGGGNGRSCENIDSSNVILGASGGGATHIALTSGLLSSLENEQDSLLIVAGGGGGADYSFFASNNYYFSYGGNAGGYIGNSANNGITSARVSGGYNGYFYIAVPGGTQSYVSSVQGGEYEYRNNAVAGTFGQGATLSAYSTAAGGGGGYYGGAAGKNWAAGGGSGYIGNSSLSNKAMYCYNCTESSDESTKTISVTNVSESAIANYAKQGNGYAKITYLG